MQKLTLSDIFFWCVTGLSAVMLVVMVLVVGGIVPIGSPSEPAGTPGEAMGVPASEQAAESTEKRTTTRETTPATTTTRTTPPPVEAGPTLVVVTATRGDSWFSARVGSENGRLLDERVLAQGESVRFEGKRIWLSIGAAGNVDVTVDGKPRAVAPGTVSVVLTPSGSPSANS